MARRKALTICRDAGQIKTRSWRVAGAGVTSLATAAETKGLGIGAVHGMSIAQGNDVFATVVRPGASNETSRLQLISVGVELPTQVRLTTIVPPDNDDPVALVR